MPKHWPYVTYNGNDIHERWVDPEWNRGLREAAAREEYQLQKRREQRRAEKDANLDRLREERRQQEAERRSLGLWVARL